MSVDLDFFWDEEEYQFDKKLRNSQVVSGKRWDIEGYIRFNESFSLPSNPREIKYPVPHRFSLFPGDDA